MHLNTTDNTHYQDEKTYFLDKDYTMQILAKNQYRRHTLCILKHLDLTICLQHTVCNYLIHYDCNIHQDKLCILMSLCLNLYRQDYYHNCGNSIISINGLFLHYLKNIQCQYLPYIAGVISSQRIHSSWTTRTFTCTA